MAPRFGFQKHCAHYTEIVTPASIGRFAYVEAAGRRVKANAAIAPAQHGKRGSVGAIMEAPSSVRYRAKPSQAPVWLMTAPRSNPGVRP